jgi:hypothetical protein
LKYSTIILAFSISVLLWVADTMDIFEAPNGWLYDQLVTLSSGSENLKSHVLLIDTGHAPEVIKPSDWQKFYTELNSHSPAMVAFTFIPDFDLQQTKNIPHVIGVPPEFVASDYRSPIEGYDVLSSARGHKALLLRPVSDKGIYRFATIRVNNEAAFSLSIAESIKGQPLLPDVTKIKVNFNHGIDSLPIVSIRRAISGGLIRELVQDRVILIGPVALLNRPGLSIPLSSESGPISLMQFEALTIETLLRADHINKLPAAVILFLLFSFSLISMIAYQRMDMSSSWRATVIMIIVYFVMSWLLLHWMVKWLPLLTFVLAQLLLFGIATRHRQLASEEALHRVLADAGSWIRGYLMPDDFYKSDHHWMQVMGMVDQSFDLQRFIFLERIEDDHRITEVSALRCSIDDIGELRRDYERAPYSTAIAKAGPLKLAKPYLDPLSEPEQQYLVPLMYADDIVGFWALSIHPEILSEVENFESNISAFAVQIAEILYHRSVWRTEDEDSNKSFSRYISFRAGDDVKKQVSKTLTSLEQRWDMIEQVLSKISTCTIVYDPFGQVLNANKSMEQLTSKFEISVYDLSALELFIQLTHLPQSMAREALNVVMSQKKSLQFPVSFAEDKECIFMLGVSAIERLDSSEEIRTEATPFDVRGVLFEVVDVSQFSMGYGIKTKFIERLIMQLRNNFQTVVTGFELSALDNVNADQRQQALKIVYDKIGDSNNLLSEAEDMMNVALHDLARHCYPLDTLAIVKASLSARKNELNTNRITLVKSFPDLLHLGFAQADRLADLFNNILEIQIKDVGVDAKIYIDITSRVDFQFIHIKGTGFGMPNEELQRYIYDDETTATEEFKRLRECVKDVSEWGGELQISSELGKGIMFELKLKSVI